MSHLRSARRNGHSGQRPHLTNLTLDKSVYELVDKLTRLKDKLRLLLFWLYLNEFRSEYCKSTLTVQHTMVKHGFLEITISSITFYYPCRIPLYSFKKFTLSSNKFDNSTWILQTFYRCSQTKKQSP